jgi:membrane protease YdiL (CAAX protease family)
MQPGLSPPRLDELLSPGRRFAFGLGLLAAHFILGGSELWGFLPDPLPMTVGPVLTLVTALLLVRWLGASFTESFAYHWPEPTQIGWAALGGLAFVLPSRILGAINTQLIDPADWYVEAMEALQPESPAEWIAHVLLVVVLVPLAEETVFRGALQPAADSVFGPAASAVIIGVMFGLFHFQPWFLLPLAVIGMMLGLTRWITGSVISCTVLHGAYNLGSVALGEWMRRSSEDGETFSTLAAGVLTLGALFSAWLCWAALGRLRPVQSGEETRTSPD